MLSNYSGRVHLYPSKDSARHALEVGIFGSESDETRGTEAKTFYITYKSNLSLD